VVADRGDVRAEDVKIDSATAFDWTLPAPPGLLVSHVALGDAEYAILSFPTPRWELPDCLTLAEREVVLALLRGRSNRDIAGARATSVRTVANQIAAVFKKLRVSSRIELARRLSDLQSAPVPPVDAG